MATENIKQKPALSTSTAALSAPTIAGSSMQGLDSNARRIVDAALAGVASAGTGDTDFALRQGLDQLKSQISAVRDTKGLVGLGALQSLGDLRNKIFENERERRVKQAEGGFAGGTQGVAAQKAFNERIGASENAIESDLLNKERSQNLQLSQYENAQLDQLRGANAFSKEMAREALRRQTTGHGHFADLVHDQNWFQSSIGRMFGKDQTWTGTLDKGRFANDPYFKHLLSELGVNTNDAAFQDRVANAMKNVYKKKQELTAFGITTDMNTDQQTGMTQAELRNLYKK